jgi:hypothetical protein
MTKSRIGISSDRLAGNSKIQEEVASLIRSAGRACILRHWAGVILLGASRPSGGAVTSLASRSAIANSAVERALSIARPLRFFGGSRAHQADKPHDLRASRVIPGWVTKVPLPLVTSTKPRSSKF